MIEHCPRTPGNVWEIEEECIYVTIDQLSISISLVRYTHIFYKNKLYKNTQAEICPKINNKLGTITRVKFSSDKFKKFIVYLILVHRLRCTCIKRLVRVSWVIGRSKSEKQGTLAVLTVSHTAG